MMKARKLLLIASMGVATVLVLPVSAQQHGNWRPGHQSMWQQNDHNSRWDWAEQRDNDRDRGPNRDNDRDRGPNRYQNSQAYQQGYRDAMRDRQHNGRWHPRGNRWKNDYDRRAYSAGYDAGFNAGRYGYGRDRDNDRGYGRNGGYYPNGGYGYPNGGYGYPAGGGYGYGTNMAARMGYQDGFSYGQRDASRGKSYNATGSEYYEDADHGYNSSFGNKNQYKQEYRQAYQAGYNRGYNSGRRY